MRVPVALGTLAAVVCLSPVASAAPSAPTQIVVAQEAPADNGSSCLALAASSVPVIATAAIPGLEIPFVSDVQTQIATAVENANNDLQRGLGVQNEQAAAFARQSSNQMADIARQVGPVVAGVAAAGLLIGACGSSTPEPEPTPV